MKVTPEERCGRVTKRGSPRHRKMSNCEPKPFGALWEALGMLTPRAMPMTRTAMKDTVLLTGL
ncbi:hypothetical protein RUM44_009317 [Polyplax serrata]|uniref:Uncharacterized protein n=1 Tax=Polyplax serrata TaxID=468196 RepID=A0ABR1ASD0_POLSC